ncbi:isochorismatase [Desulfoscipio sp. XC116]|uniref:isochorismatase n=1 Tax=Desulfoscipio sp. XC116 TaxID=3144975 RepID=UPI00325B30B2
MMVFPSYYNKNKASELYLPRYDKVVQEATGIRNERKIAPAGSDQIKIALFVIDMQIGFCHPDGSLSVPGAVDDVVRLCDFIYGNLEKLSEIHLSLDTHRAYQIFHPSWWADKNGFHPAPYTIITYNDIQSGKWMPQFQPALAADYIKRLEAAGKYNLCIWPFHTMLGSIDHALMPILFEAALFHAIARKVRTNFEIKGEHPLTENYSVLSPEVKELTDGSDTLNVGSFNTKFFNALMRNDRVYIAGEASSHCVKATIEDLLDIHEANPNLVHKVYILQDCMSPVPGIPGVVDFPAIARQSLQRFKDAGMRVVNSTDSNAMDAVL